MMAVGCGAPFETWARAEKTPFEAADPRIGSDKAGNVFVGACQPFGLVKLGPDVVPPQPTNGYVSDKPLIGFSATHTSGTGGGGRYGNFLVLPMAEPAPAGVAKADEEVQPGYYAVTLPAAKVRCELTASPRCAYHRYTFTDSDAASLLIDVASSRITGTGRGNGAKCLEADVTVMGDRKLEGWMTSKGGWGHNEPHKVYFSAEFSRPFTKADITRDTRPATQSTEAPFVTCKVVTHFDTASQKDVELRMGVSVSSMENARKHLSQTDGQSFDDCRKSAAQAWTDYLAKIDLDGASDEQRTLFYSALYRTGLMPTDITGDNPRWQSDEPHFWDYFAIWDTFRCTNAMYTLIQPQKQRDMLRCLLDVYKHDGWLPDAWIAGHLSMIQGGTNADTLLADAAVKQLGGFDLNLAYEAAKHDATVPSDNGFLHGRYKDYFTYGYLPATSLTDKNPNYCPTSRTLEYAANDFSVSELARLTGHPDEAAKFKEQSLKAAYALFNNETKFFDGKSKDGQVMSVPDPAKGLRSGFGIYYEGTAWQYAFAVPEDIAGLIAHHGGSDKFEAFLDKFFEIKNYNPGNEPDLLVPWLYPYVNKPAKGVDIIRALMKENYHTGPAGLPGNDDSGTLSTWYLFAALGFYPNVGQDLYLIASPTVPKATFHLENNKTFIITANNLSPENRFIQSATLNGQPLDHAWFKHTQIKDGGALAFEMGPTPSAWGTTGALPPSESDK